MNLIQPPSDIAYFQSIDNLIDQFQTDTKLGLNTSDIETKFLKYGYNELPKIKKSLWKIYLAPIFNFLIIILIISGAIVVTTPQQVSLQDARRGLAMFKQLGVPLLGIVENMSVFIRD